MGGKSIFALSLASVISFIPYLHRALSPLDMTDTINTSFILMGTTLAAISLFTFSLEYTHRSHWIGWLTISLFAIVPLFTQIIFWLPGIVDFFQLDFSLPTNLGNFEMLERINTLYRYSIVTATIWLLGRFLFLRFGHFNFQFWYMLTGPLIAFITQGFMLLGLQWNWLEGLYLFSINLCAIGFAYNSFRLNPNAGRLVWRGNVIENLEDGWIIINMQNSIVDFNQATAKLANMSRDKMYGKPISSILIGFSDLTNMLEESQEIEMDRTLKVKGEYHYLNIRGSTLKNDAGVPIGRLVIWRDITNQRRAEDARQRARDEMFVLLNAISSSASQTASLNEFLSDALYQIIYPFRSQVIFVCLLDERSNRQNEKEEYYLAVHLGLSFESSKELDKFCFSLPLFEWLHKNRKPLLLEDPQDPRIPDPIRAFHISYLLVIPLIVRVEEGEKFIGSLFMGRKHGSVYNQDEIVRLTMIAEQIATLIDSDRRRKLAIALSERQRLMRDVHDSVSQKLYGLVTLTEAAQAAREAGTPQDYGQILSRIGENARQAVKELRLFLFQMQPINLEEGLISALHHRLAAVEGRADIKARFLADEPILLSRKKQVALYYIAQEALNNVLRHAFAKSVTVTLKQGYKYVTFEIKDDGCGFDRTKLERGGLGLKNLTERVKQENGKLKILSKPGKGTIIRVTLEKDMQNNSGKK